MNDLEDFRESVGESDPVAVVGGRTHWTIGGNPTDDTRLICAPVGIDSFDPSEMTVSVKAGTKLKYLNAELSGYGQEVCLEGSPETTVGGALMTGTDGIRRNLIGSIRETLLQAEYVDAKGKLIKAGGPTVKNVTGYDLCRLLVGSLGTLGLVGRVILRTRPQSEKSVWLQGGLQPEEARHVCFQPASLLWNGKETFIQLEGHGIDVDSEVLKLKNLGYEEMGKECPISIPRFRHKFVNGMRFNSGIVDVYSSIIYKSEEAAEPQHSKEVVRLGNTVRKMFDPSGRLNPGRDPYRAGP